MAVSSRGINASFIVGILINIIIAYLFYLNIINLTILLIVIGTFIFIMIIISLQLKTNEIRNGLNIQNSRLIRLEEKLKIHEELINIKADIKSLQEKLKNGKRQRPG